MTFFCIFDVKISRINVLKTPKGIFLLWHLLKFYFLFIINLFFIVENGKRGIVFFILKLKNVIYKKKKPY